MVNLFPKISHYVKWEVYQDWTRGKRRDADYLFARQPANYGEIPPGLLVAEVTSNETTVTAGSGNTGNGTLAVDLLHKPAAQIGNYIVKCTDISGGAGAEVWSIYNVEGTLLSDSVTTGVAFTSYDIDVTITAGGTDFVVDDLFNIAVVYGVRPLDLTASNGLQTVIGINALPVQNRDFYVNATLILRGQALVVFDRLFELYEKYTRTILTSGQKTALIAALEAKDIYGE